ncbi:MAG: shikimate kinase [Bacillaceae bacterium]
MKAIYLIGFMGAGKTTVGKQLGKNIELPVYDVDTVIEKKQHRCIKAIFATEGERYFRQIESCVLKELPTKNAVITTGGGIIGNDENVTWMKENGIVVYLHATFSTIVERVGSDTNRPLFQTEDMEKTRNLYESRLPLYKQAHFTIETEAKSVGQIANEIEACIRQLA